MKYKFDLSPEIKATVEWQLRYYREDRRQLDEYIREMIPSPTQAYSLTAGVDGGKIARSTEEITTKLLSSPYLHRLELSCKAIERAMERFDAMDKKLIELIYWRKEFTVEGAGLRLHISKTAAYQRINKILGTVAYELGYVSV